MLAKSDTAALGVYGVGLQRVRGDAKLTDWDFQTFDDSQAPSTRLAVMELLGVAIGETMSELSRILMTNSCAAAYPRSLVQNESDRIVGADWLGSPDAAK